MIFFPCWVGFWPSITFYYLTRDWPIRLRPSLDQSSPVWSASTVPRIKTNEGKVFSILNFSIHLFFFGPPCTLIIFFWTFPPRLWYFHPILFFYYLFFYFIFFYYFFLLDFDFFKLQLWLSSSLFTIGVGWIKLGPEYYSTHKD